MLGWPLAMGVPTGPFSPTWVFASDSNTARADIVRWSARLQRRLPRAPIQRRLRWLQRRGTVASATSGPMPSPGIRVIGCVTYRSIRALRRTRPVENDHVFPAANGEGQAQDRAQHSGRSTAGAGRLAAREDIRSIIPGVIRPVRDAKGAVKIRITVPTPNGWKAIGTCQWRPAGAVYQHGAGSGRSWRRR